MPPDETAATATGARAAAGLTAAADLLARSNADSPRVLLDAECRFVPGIAATTGACAAAWRRASAPLLALNGSGFRTATEPADDSDVRPTSSARAAAAARKVEDIPSDR